MAVEGYNPQAVGPRTQRAIRARGLRPVVGDYARWGLGVLGGLPRARGDGGEHGSFELLGRSYAYRYHPYKFTWLTERAVEVPVAQALVDAHAGRRILEVGHVLGHYSPGQAHTVVDKYERGPGVLNRDIFDLEDLGPFDLVVAVSTLEHVGWDEDPRRPELAPEAVHALRGLLAAGGTMLLTVPVGYHPGLDAACAAGAYPFTRTSALRRERIGPHWVERDPAAVWGTPYDFLLYSARAVFFGLIEG